MLKFNEYPLHFVAYSKIAEYHPKFVAQTGMDEYGRSLNIWQVNDQYFICVSQ